MLVSKALQSFLVREGQCSDNLSDAELIKVAQTALNNGTLSAEKFAELQAVKSAADVFGGARVKASGRAL